MPPLSRRPSGLALLSLPAPTRDFELSSASAPAMSRSSSSLSSVATGTPPVDAAFSTPPSTPLPRSPFFPIPHGLQASSKVAGSSGGGFPFFSFTNTGHGANVPRHVGMTRSSSMLSETSVSSCSEWGEEAQETDDVFTVAPPSSSASPSLPRAQAATTSKTKSKAKARMMDEDVDVNWTPEEDDVLRKTFESMLASLPSNPAFAPFVHDPRTSPPPNLAHVLARTVVSSGGRAAAVGITKRRKVVDSPSAMDGEDYKMASPRPLPPRSSASSSSARRAPWRHSLRATRIRAQGIIRARMALEFNPLDRSDDPPSPTRPRLATPEKKCEEERVANLMAMDDVDRTPRQTDIMMGGVASATAKKTVDRAGADTVKGCSRRKPLLRREHSMDFLNDEEDPVDDELAGGGRVQRLLAYNVTQATDHPAIDDGRKNPLGSSMHHWLCSRLTPAAGADGLDGPLSLNMPVMR